jgi:N-acetylneuraminic acid mutarotase
MLGGYCTKEKKLKRSCSRYNIVTEKWQQTSPMIFHKENSASCAINEFQIIVAGGRIQGGLTDIVEIYDLRENSWKVFSVGISSPRQLMKIVSAQKDRAIIIGGQDQDGNDIQTVEEIDFLKV